MYERGAYYSDQSYYGRATDMLRACKFNFLVLMFDINLFCLYKFLMGWGIGGFWFVGQLQFDEDKRNRFIKNL
jgi:hypothetical protein